MSPVQSPKASAGLTSKRQKQNGNITAQFQFVTATDPSHFKDESAKKSVRSQAMIHYTRLKAEERKQNSQNMRRETLRVHDVTPSPTTTRHISTPLAIRGHQYDQKQYSSHDSDEGNSPEETISAMIETSTQHMPTEPILCIESRQGSPLGPEDALVIDYRPINEHEQFVYCKLIKKAFMSHPIGDAHDPFKVFPQFKSPELNGLDLVRKSRVAMSSDSTVQRWLPGMISHPHIILSSTILVSCWLDMRAGQSGESRRTVTVKAETMDMINERLCASDTRFDDVTLMAILHLLVGNIWSCDERTLQIHASGAASLIIQRGGMQSLNRETIAEVAAACCLHCDIFCEAKPLPIFQAWTPPNVHPVEDLATIPESPLFCPSERFDRIIDDPHCSGNTYSILCDMRDLTDLFITHNARLATSDNGNDEEEYLGPRQPEIDLRAGLILERLASLPSAHQSDLSTSNDWVFETCRITALIYAAAIMMRVPFSVAADPRRNVILSTAYSNIHSNSGNRCSSRPLTEVLHETLERTNTDNLWKGLAGVLYWVSAVGAAAARTPATIDMSQKQRFQDEAYSTWVRRCLVMTSTRTMIILVFQHPIFVIMAQKKLLMIQALIRSPATRDDLAATMA